MCFVENSLNSHSNNNNNNNNRRKRSSSSLSNSNIATTSGSEDGSRDGDNKSKNNDCKDNGDEGDGIDDFVQRELVSLCRAVLRDGKNATPTRSDSRAGRSRSSSCSGYGGAGSGSKDNGSSVLWVGNQGGDPSLEHDIRKQLGFPPWGSLNRKQSRCVRLLKRREQSENTVGVSLADLGIGANLDLDVQDLGVDASGLPEGLQGFWAMFDVVSDFVRSPISWFSRVVEGDSLHTNANEYTFTECDVGNDPYEEY